MVSGSLKSPAGSGRKEEGDKRDDADESERFMAAAHEAAADGAIFDDAMAAMLVKKNVRDVGR